MPNVIDFAKRRPPLDQQRKQARTEELRDALRSAREESAGKPAQSRAAHKLLDIYRSKPPRKP
jgi:hypothetical protein